MTKGILDTLTQKQRQLVLGAYRSEWPRFRGDQYNKGTIKALARDGIIQEVGKGFYELAPSARNAVKLHLKVMGE